MIGRLPQLLYLPDEVRLLVVELLILSPVRVELHQKFHKLVLIAKKDVQYRLWLIWICNKHLKTSHIVLLLRVCLYVP